MRALLQNKDGDKRALKVVLSANRWLSVNPPEREGQGFVTELTPQEATDLLAGKTIREEDMKLGKCPSVQLIL